jgi:hypothetical protein
MGLFNSSATRVQPVLNALRERDRTGVWPSELWRMARATRGTETALPPPTFGELFPGNGYERVVPPSTAFLKWAIENPERLTVLRDFGATGELSTKKRADLFGSDPARRAAVTAEALKLVEAQGGKNSARQWWAFEGFTHVDACLESSNALLVVEGKRTESVSSSTRWFSQRNQLWRNVEVAQEMAAGKAFGVILAVETAEAGRMALDDAIGSRVSSYPHRTDAEQMELDRHLLGFVVWSEIVRVFELPPSCMVDSWEPKTTGPS